MNKHKEIDVAVECIGDGKYGDAYKILSDIGNCDEAQFYLAWLLKEGKGVAQDLPRARKLYKEDMGHRHVERVFYLGNIAEIEGQTNEAIDFYTRAFEENNLPSAYRLGMIYADDASGVKNIEKAKYYLESAAQRGHVFSRRKLAGMMLRGRFGIFWAVVGLFVIIRICYDLLRIYFSNSHDERLQV